MSTSQLLSDAHTLCLSRAIASPCAQQWRDLAAVADVVRRLLRLPAQRWRLTLRDATDAEAARWCAEAVVAGAADASSTSRRQALDGLAVVASEIAEEIARCAE